MKRLAYLLSIAGVLATLPANSFANSKQSIQQKPEIIACGFTIQANEIFDRRSAEGFGRAHEEANLRISAGGTPTLCKVADNQIFLITKWNVVTDYTFELFSR